MYETISVEDRKKPAVGLIYKDFANDAHSAASSKGVPLVRLVPETIPSEWTNLKDIDEGISAVIDEIIEGLTKPLSDEERSPKPKAVEKPERIIFKGDLEEVNLFLYLRGWTDGLPIIPPTEEKVAEMVEASGLPANHMVAMLGPRMGKATIEKIAVNAVMAGALPTHMPLLVAGVKCLADPIIGPTGLAVSTLSFAPLWIINGPMRQEINVNQGYGALSPGDIANAAIGRALGLITKNIRGVRKGMEDMGVLGNPTKYCMVVGENEEESPWDPLHMEHGLKKEDSAITLVFSRAFVTLQPYGTEDKGILNTIIYNIWPEGDGTVQIMLTPTLAKALASAGWSKKATKEYIQENTRVPNYRHPKSWSGGVGAPGKVLPLGAADSMAILRKPEPKLDPVLIFVAGGSGSRIGLFGGSARSSTTKKVELPANWGQLVRKYKNVVPSYVRY